MAKSVWLLVSLFFVLVQHTFAAEITVVPGKSNDYALIFIVGEITKLDAEKFENIAIRTAHGGVVLNSPGGSVLAGINIGKVIQLRGYDTAVPEGATCASACGFIWLAGAKRFVFPDARIGFHSAYQFENGQVQESGMANALVGAYYNQIGLSSSAIAWLTSASPHEMIWLHAVEARDLGIDVQFLDSSAVANNSPQSSPSISHEPESMNIIEGRDIYGYDIGKPVIVDGVKDCESRCRSTQSCRAFTHNSQNGNCYLKHNGGDVFWYKNVTSGYVAKIANNLNFMKIVIVNSTALKGATYKSFSDVVLEACAKYCNEEQVCSGFEYQSRPVKLCSLKTGKLVKIPKKRQTSGIKTSK